MTPTVAILGTRYPDFAIEREVLEPLGVHFVDGNGVDSAAIIDQAGSADFILAGSAPKFDAATLASLSCTGIVRYGVGTESIDLAAAKELGIWVLRVADYGTEAVATHAVAMALAGVRRLREADQRIRSGNWGFAPLRPLHLPSAMTVGVVGTGRIGRHAAGQFVGLGFRVLSYDIVEPVEKMAGVTFVSSLEELVVASDVISLHVPGAPDGTPLLTAELMSRLKPGCIIVNTSRGTLIDLKVLAEGLADGKPSYAALDVFAKEPPDLSIFQGVEDQLLLTPHMAWYTEESESDLRLKAAQEVRRLILGERPKEIVVEPTIKRVK
ncbi:MAG TPA: C-terminal binding protein [archaeon]|nr:C-terminal binding protein [archaeon]